MIKKTLAVLFLLIVSFVVGSNYYGDYQAQSLCTKIPIGSNVKKLLELERTENITHYVVKDTGAYQYGFRGFIFSAGICEFTVENEKVTAKRFYHFDLK